jgi:hypothetical protein
MVNYYECAAASGAFSLFKRWAARDFVNGDGFEIIPCATMRLP